jgi:hypothetical protein
LLCFSRHFTHKDFTPARILHGVFFNLKNKKMKKSTFLLALLTFLTICSYAQPSGTIIAFGGPKAKIPKGWVICDGTLFDRTNATYKNLFDAIGVSWGGDGGNKFAVPDLRGQFLRGVTETINLDPDAATRDKSRPELNSSGNGGNAVGSKQKDVFGFHDHDFKDNGHRHAVAKGYSTDGGTNGPDGGELTNGGHGGVNKIHFSDTNPSNINFTSKGGNETRPTNAYVYYIIKL